MIARINQPVPFEVTYDSPTLFVAATLWDISGVTPTQVGALIPLVHFSGNSYAAKFTPTSEAPLVLNIAVYTDGTYATRDANYSEASQAYQPVWDGGGSGQDSVIGIIEPSADVLGLVEE